MRNIPPLPRGHACDLPWKPGGYGSTGVPDGTIAICDCGKAWYSAPCYQSLGPVTYWRRVRPWHFRLRAALNTPEGVKCADG